MTNNMLLIGIAATIIVAGCAIGAFMIINNDDDSDNGTKDASESTFCWVYGNANMDNKIDESDKEYVQMIIDGEKETTKYADANNDGTVDSKDIAYIEDLINFTGGKRYYTMDNGETGWIKGNITSIGAQYYCNMYALGAMGATGIVTCGDDETAELANKGEFGATVKAQNLKKYGYTGGYEPETLLSMGCQAILCGTSYFKDWEEMYWNEERYIAFIRLACWKVDPIAAVVTVANLLQNEDYVNKAIEYADYANSISEKVQKNTEGLSHKKTVAIIYPYSDGRMEFQGRTTGCYEASLLAGLDNIASFCDPDKDDDGGFHILDLETALKYDPDAIIILKGCGWTKTQTDVDNAYVNYVEKYLSTRTAVKEGNVWFSSWRFTQGVFQPVGAMMMASEIYGSVLFDDADAMTELQKYVDKFTSVNLGLNPGDDGYLDVTKTGMYFNKATAS